MKPGLQIGQSATIHTKVTAEMFARFEGDIVHPVYSTVSMVYHMEWASRKIILPYLEEDEEGMGAAVSAKHIAPSLEGACLTVTAKVIEFERNIVVTEVSVSQGTELVGIGKVKQVILSKQNIAEKLKQRPQ